MPGYDRPDPHGERQPMRANHSGDLEFSASLLAVSDTVGPGDWVLVRSGLVLARLTEHEAMDALELREPTSQGAP